MGGLSPQQAWHPRSTSSGTPSDHQIPTDEERTSKIHRICKLLKKLHSPIIREDRSIPRIHQVRQASKNRPRTHIQFRSHQQVTRQCMWPLAQTATAKPAVRANDRRQLQKRRIRLDD